MLQVVKTPARNIRLYKKIIEPTLFNKIQKISKDLKGARIIMVNATPKGGGVAEILQSLIPLMKSTGIDASWHVLTPDAKFFDLTKNLHNALQGKKYFLSPKLKKFYNSYQEKTAKLMKNMRADIWVVHDPQPAGIIKHFSGLNPAISHVHIDTSYPNKEVWKFLESFLVDYDKIIFSVKDFVAKSLPVEKVVVFPPAIDPLTIKNKPLQARKAKKILSRLGINTKKPLVSQVSRFDPWKDPLGAVRAYKLAKKQIPNLQLALVGLILAVDDPEAIKIFKEVKAATKDDPDIFLFADPKILRGMKVDTFVNAFQAGSDIILQKSTKEGFGLTVTEAMWKGKPVIGGNVGGIKIQIKDKKTGFLVSSPEEAAQDITSLFKNPKLNKKIGKAARESVRKNFLMPRLLRDYLKLFRELI